MCSMILTLFHKDTLKYTEDMGIYLAADESQQFKKLYPGIQTPVSPRLLEVAAI